MARPDQARLEFELARRLERFQASSPYEVFELWEGCGRQVLQTRYYELVKIHHPDRYGGNLTGQIKKLSQSVFLEVQDAYQVLRLEEAGEQTSAPPDERRAKALESLARQSAEAARQSEESQQKRQQRMAQIDRVEPSAVFEAVTISERDASTLEEDSLPEEERREKLAKLARTARSNKIVRPPLAQVLSGARLEATTLEEDSALSIEQRREKLAKLSTRQKTIPKGFTLNASPSDVSLESQSEERTPSLTVESAPMADASSSGVIRGLSSQQARRQADVSAHLEVFSRGVAEFREGRFERALQLVAEALKTEPTNALYTTYHAYLEFMSDGAKRPDAEATLRQVIEKRDRRAAPDAHLFLGFILKASGSRRDAARAMQHFRTVLELNPSNHEAAREVRLYEMRHKQESEPRFQDDIGGFFKRLFKK